MPKFISALGSRITGYFVAGLVAIMPIVLTVAIVVWVAVFLQGYLGPETFLGRGLGRLGGGLNISGKFASYATGWLLVLGTIFVFGFVVEAGAKRLYQGLMDRLFKRVPVIGSVYGTTKQFVDMFDHKDQAELKSMSVVFCVFGSEGGSGVLALMPSPERFLIEGHDYHVVIIPTAPVPFGGGLLFVPAESVHATAMSVDGLMSIYVSMGVTTPQFMSKRPDPA